MISKDISLCLSITRPKISVVNFTLLGFAKGILVLFVKVLVVRIVGDARRQQHSEGHGIVNKRQILTSIPGRSFVLITPWIDFPIGWKGWWNRYLG